MLRTSVCSFYTRAFVRTHAFIPDGLVMVVSNALVEQVSFAVPLAICLGYELVKF